MSIGQRLDLQGSEITVLTLENTQSPSKQELDIITEVPTKWLEAAYARVTWVYFDNSSHTRVPSTFQ